MALFEQEIWKPIPGYEMLYEVSSFGEVRTTAKQYRIKTGTVNKTNLLGYWRVRIHKNRQPKHFLVHRLMALAFLGPPNGLQVNHINGIRSDNRLVNVEYVTVRGNAINREYRKQNKLPLGVVRVQNVHGISYRAVITKNRRSIHLGTFGDTQSASAAYLAALQRIEPNVNIRIS